jgi:hypothetical protein
MVEVQMKTVPPFIGKLDEEKTGKSGTPRLFTTALIFGLFLALGATSWLVLYISNVNVGD